MLDEPDVIRKKFKTAVTDSGREVRKADDKPGVSNLIDIMSVATGSTPEQIEAEYGDAGYGTFKLAVGEAVVELLAPIRERYAELRADEAELLRLLALGADKARATSTPTLERDVRGDGVRAAVSECACRREAALRRVTTAPRAAGGASTSSRVSERATSPIGTPADARGPRSRCAAAARPGSPTASHIRRTWRLRPSCSTSSTRERPSCRARAGAVMPSSSSTPAASADDSRGRQVALDIGDVGLLDAVARMREPVGEIAVVREQEHAARVDVQPADRNDARLVADEIDDGRAALGIAARS